MQRIMIIGCGGAGKSHVGRALCEITGLPLVLVLVHLDQHYWMPGWIEPDKKDWKDKMKLLTQEERWIMDGKLWQHDGHSNFACRCNYISRLVHF